MIHPPPPPPLHEEIKRKRVLSPPRAMHVCSRPKRLILLNIRLRRRRPRFPLLPMTKANFALFLTPLRVSPTYIREAAHRVLDK
jgi:hypothetical protein